MTGKVRFTFINNCLGFFPPYLQVLADLVRVKGSYCKMAYKRFNFGLKKIKRNKIKSGYFTGVKMFPKWK